MVRPVIAFGLKDNFMEDVHILGKRWSENPRITIVPGPATKTVILEKASALFTEEEQVLAFLDPPPNVIKDLAAHLVLLKERVGLVIYSTSDDFDLPPSLDAERVNMEKEKQERVKSKVLAAVRVDGKKMTDKAYALLKERVKDEAILDTELAKLISYVGDKTVIEVRDVAAVTTEGQEGDFITLSEAMARKDKKQVMLILDTLLSQGLNILAVHGFMTRHIGLLLQARDAEEFLGASSDFRQFSKEFGGLKKEMDETPAEKRNFLAYQKPYYAYNLCKTGRRFTDDVLLSFLTMLTQFDRMVKTGTKYDRVNFELGLLKI
jgi:DNA polymerase III delta subunit